MAKMADRSVFTSVQIYCALSHGHMSNFEELVVEIVFDVFI